MTDHERELLAAERRGRSVTLLQNPGPGSVWRVAALDNADGHALLAASRWGARLGAAVDVRLATPDAPSPVWAALAESCRRQGLVDETLPYIPVRENRLISHNHQGGMCDLFPRQIPGADRAWSFTLGQSELFVRPVPPDAPALSCAQCRNVDKTAIEILGVPGLCLMENAAIGAGAVAMDMLHRRRGMTLILAGGGNNGGDGLALARGMWELGLECEVALAKPPSALAGDAASNHRLLRETTGIPVHELAGNPSRVEPLLDKAVLIVDGLLGTGFKGGLSPEYAGVIKSVNASAKPVLGLDIPSGLHGDTGEVSDVAVVCERTVTFAAMKTGLRQGRGPELAGSVYCADIGAPNAAFGNL